jgi:uncharacterized protein YjbI with pentapeptide repeats
MADTNTSNLNLTKPEVGASSDTWGTKWNSNADAIDALFGAGPALLVAKGGTGATTAANARTNLGLGTIATQNANAVAITGGTVSGITDLAIADGGTGASDAAGARTNLGLGGLAVLSTVGASEITDGSVGTAELADSAVTTAKIADANITTAKIADANVTTAKIVDANVTTAKIADASITPAKLSGAQTGSAPLYGARAWVTFDGTATPPTISASGNVSSVTRSATGDYTINFSTALPDANYAVSAIGKHATDASNIVICVQGTPTSSAIRIQCTSLSLSAGTASTAAYSPSRVSLVVFG